MSLQAKHADGSICKAKDPATCRFRGGVVNVTITRHSTPADIARALDFANSETPPAPTAEDIPDADHIVHPRLKPMKVPFWLGDKVVFKGTGVTGKVISLRGGGGVMLDSTAREFKNFKWEEIEGTEEYITFLEAMAAQGKFPK